MGEGIFSGLKVLDVGSFIAAPAAATIMADFGAEVIKIEAPGDGDPYRGAKRGKRYPSSPVPHQWIVDNRNKKGIALDLKTDAGREILYCLVRDADVFVTNMPLGPRERLRIRYEDIAPLNERIIYASLTAYGETGADAARTGFDSTAWWARTGLMDLVKPSPDSAPARSMPGMGDHPTAVAMYGAIVTGLYRRERTGKGGLVCTSLMSNGLWSNAIMVQAQLSGGVVEPRPAREDAENAFNNLYRTSDGYWLHLVMMHQEHRWADFARVVGAAELADDPRYATVAAREENAKSLINALDVVFRRRNRQSWRDLLSANGFTFGEVASVGDVAIDQQMKDSGALRPMPDPRAGASHIVDSPIQIGGVEKETPTLAPELGEHTVEVLRAAGYDDTEIARFQQDGVVA